MRTPVLAPTLPRANQTQSGRTSFDTPPVGNIGSVQTIRNPASVLSKFQPVSVPEHDAHLTSHSGLTAFLFVLQCLGTELEAELVERAATPDGEVGVVEMLALAGAQGHEAWLQTCGWEALAAVPYPALAELKDGRFLVLGAFAQDRVLVQDPRRIARAAAVLREHFAAIWNGRLVLLTTRADGYTDRVERVRR